MIIDFDWFNAQGVKNALNAVMTILGIVRIVVPIALIAMTTLDITKNVINPDDKDGQKKIMTRAVAALLVFISPIVIGFVLNFMGIDTSGLGGINSNFESKDITPTYVKPEDPVELSSLSLFNCPNIMKVGDSVELKTNIPENYKGSIVWEENKHILDIAPSSDKRSATVKVESDDFETTTTLTVKAGGMTKYCFITVSASFSISNCPSTSRKFKPGERVTLVTDINSKYNGKILWDQDKDIFNMTPTSDGKGIILEVVENPSDITSTITAIKGQKNAKCLILVEKPKLDSVSITNCPATTEYFHPGDEITLYTDIPADFKGDIKWIPDRGINNFEVIPSSDNRSATLRVKSNLSSKFSTTTVLAGGVASACTIFVSE